MSLQSRFLLLGRHNAMAASLVVQFAVGFTLICGAWQGYAAWKAQRSSPSGIQEAELSLLPWIRPAEARAIRTEDVIGLLRTIPGVRRVAASNQSPFGQVAWSSLVRAGHGPRAPLAASVYLGSEDFLETLGLRLKRGRDFLPAEYTDYRGDPAAPHAGPAPVIVSSALAERLFDTEDALGRSLYLRAGVPLHVVGVVERIPIPANGPGADDRLALILPVRMTDARDARFLLRSSAGDRDDIARQARDRLALAYPASIIDAPVGLASLRDDTFSGERRRARWMALACGAWWVLTLSGLLTAGQGWAQRRALELSLRRALGATQRQIAHALSVEFLLLGFISVLLGLAVWRSPLPRHWLPWTTGEEAEWLLLAVAAFVVCAGQLVAIWTARKAGEVPPSRVSRSPSVRL